MIPADPVEAEARRIKAHLAMLAARDTANFLIKHGLALAADGCQEAAAKFNAHAAMWRDYERDAAQAAGLAALE